MNQKSKISGLVIFLTLATFESEAIAATILFSDKSTFISSTGATSATGTIPNLGSVGSSFTLGSVTFTISPPATELFIGASGTRVAPDWSSVGPGNEIAISGIENLNANFSSPVFSAGFDFIEPTDETCFATCFDSTFDVILKNSGVIVDSFTFNAPNDVLAFIGIWTDSAFDRMEIVDTTATIDDEFFGEFYTGSSPVPLPAAVWLFGSGLIGLAGIARRKA